MLAQNALLLCTQPENRCARLFIEPVGNQFNAHAAPGFKCVSQQQQLTFGVDGRALCAPRKPRIADRALAILREDFVVPSAADDLILSVRISSNDYKRELVPVRQSIESELNVLLHSVWSRNDGHWRIPEFSVSGRRIQSLLVRETDRVQTHGA